jgi:hypothetical protein
MSLEAFNPNYKSYDFEVKKEDWNEYELQDSTRVRGKLVLTRIIKRDNTPANAYEIIAQPMFTVTTDTNRRKPPTQALTPDEVAQLNLPGPNELKVPMEVLTYAERWNQYFLPATDETIRVKMVLIDIYRIPDRYDDLGEPMFWFVTGNVIAPLPPHGRIAR